MIKVLLSGPILFVVLCVFNGCNTGSEGGRLIYAEVDFTQDVSGINMSDVGVTSPEIIQNETYELKQGSGTVYWVSSGVEYSRDIEIGDSEHENQGEEPGADIECEQEGEHEGENEGCVFSFLFSKDMLAISKR